MNKCKHFIIQELVDPKTYELRGDRAWELIDYRVIYTLDRLRERYGSTTVNNWKWGKDRKWSGLRTPESKWFSQYSQHTFGRAADCIFQDIDAESVRQDILADPNHEDFKYINSLEMGVSWLHFDCRGDRFNGEEIIVFYP